LRLRKGGYLSSGRHLLNHVAADLCTIATFLAAASHDFVARHLFACHGALFTTLRAAIASVTSQRAPPCGQRRPELAGFAAIEAQFQGFHVFAVSGGNQAQTMLVAEIALQLTIGAGPRTRHKDHRWFGIRSPTWRRDQG
jgi:hypothetical protein